MRLARTWLRPFSWVVLRFRGSGAAADNPQSRIAPFRHMSSLRCGSKHDRTTTSRSFYTG